MNPWIEKSIQVANQPGYLDKLQEVYPVVQETERILPPEQRKQLEEIYSSGDDLQLLQRLLDFPKFPVKDPYVAFLRKDKKFLEENPETVKRIAGRIRALGFQVMMKGLEEPKEFNRQMGGLFRKWLAKLGYPILPEEEFESTEEKIAFLLGTDRQLKEFADKKLRCDLPKGPDFLAKVGSKYILGEAKFLTDYGGHQNAQFQDALRFLSGGNEETLRVAVLDGVLWIRGNTKMHSEVRSLQKPAFTALLLKQFLEEEAAKDARP